MSSILAAELTPSVLAVKPPSASDSVAGVVPKAGLSGNTSGKTSPDVTGWKEDSLDDGKTGSRDERGGVEASGVAVGDPIDPFSFGRVNPECEPLLFSIPLDIRVTEADASGVIEAYNVPPSVVLKPAISIELVRSWNEVGSSWLKACLFGNNEIAAGELSDPVLF